MRVWYSAGLNEKNEELFISPEIFLSVPVRLGNRTYLGWRENLNWEQGTERNSYFFVDMIY